MASDTPPTEWRKEVTSIVEKCEVPGVNGTKLLEEVEKLWYHPNYKDFDNKFEVELKLFNDPIHGSIQLNMLENAIVNTPEFNRLKDIKQLGGKSHVFPGATHSRFEHSIGVCHLAGKLIKHLKEGSPGHEVTKQQILCVQLAGLCHDLGHGPFSHLFDGVSEHICGKNKKEHEEISGLLFKRILVKHPKVLVIFLKCKLTAKNVTTIVDMMNCSKKFMDDVLPEEKYLYEIVANKTSGMDVDKWDYFARDCHYLGLKNEFDMERCIALSRIVNHKGQLHVGFREKELGNIYGMFRTRCILYQKAYLHKTGNGIDLMIKDAILVAQDVKLQLPESPACTSLKQILTEDMKEENLDGYILLTDSFLGALMIMPTVEGTQANLKVAQRIVQRLSQRDIYKPVCSLSFYSDDYDKPLKEERDKLQSCYKPEDPKEEPPQKNEEKCYKPGDYEVEPPEEKGYKPGDYEVEPPEEKGYKPGDYEVEIVSIKYASEDAGKSGDPVARNMYFFKKENNWKPIPEAIENGEGSEMEDCSKLILPKAFVEYRITLYYKGEAQLGESEKEMKKKEFETKVQEMMSKSKKKVP